MGVVFVGIYVYMYVYGYVYVYTSYVGSIPHPATVFTIHINVQTYTIYIYNSIIYMNNFWQHKHTQILLIAKYA